MSSVAFRANLKMMSGNVWTAVLQIWMHVLSPKRKHSPCTSRDCRWCTRERSSDSVMVDWDILFSAFPDIPGSETRESQTTMEG